MKNPRAGSYTTGQPPKAVATARAKLKMGSLAGTKGAIAQSLGVSRTTFNKIVDELTATGEAVFGKAPSGAYHLALSE